MILWDSKKRGGRPDTVKLLKETLDSFGAEVIFITSNKQGNDEMMRGCRAGTFNQDLLPQHTTNFWYSRITRLWHSMGLLIGRALSALEDAWFKWR